MLSDDEKARIIEKVTFEREIKDSLNPPKPRAHIWDKFNSNLFLLLIGSLITGLLVPIFQNHQKSIEWKRQVQYDKIKFNLEMMRDCLKEFVFLTQYTSQAYERIRPLINQNIITKKDFDDSKQIFFEIQNARYQQIVKVKSLVIYFQDANGTMNLINDYVTSSTGYIRNIEHFLMLKYHPSHSGSSSISMANGNKAEISNTLRVMQDIKMLDNKFACVIAKIQTEIAKIEESNANINF